MRQLTHVELLHRPGERALAAKFFGLLGCEPADRGGVWFTSFIDPANSRDYSNNVFYASEVGAEQWAFEEAIVAQLEPSRRKYLEAIQERPQKSAHFGFRVGTRAELDSIAAAVAQEALADPDLKGRVRIAGCLEPDAPDAVATNMVQLFVWTDIVTCGLVALGQHIEIQWHLPATTGRE
jgi:hypothetical protein